MSLPRWPRVGRFGAVKGPIISFTVFSRRSIIDIMHFDVGIQLASQAMPMRAGKLEFNRLIA